MVPTPADGNVLSPRIEHEWDKAIRGRDGAAFKRKLDGGDE